MFKVPPSCCLYQNFIPFVFRAEEPSTVWRDRILLILSSAVGPLGCFPHWAVMSSAIMNKYLFAFLFSIGGVGGCVCLCVCVCSMYLGVESLGHRGILAFTLGGMSPSYFYKRGT